MQQLYFDAAVTPIGCITLLGSRLGICKVLIEGTNSSLTFQYLRGHHAMVQYKPTYFADLREQLAEYFKGDRIKFDVTLDMSEVSPFLRKAWLMCREIPYGETRSYKWLASEIGNPAAVRAVGQAMARNALPLVVPCHRIIGRDGKLCGFGRGQIVRQHLLNLEQR